MMLGPYDLNQIYTGDARELAQAIPDESCTLAFADPPYWVGFDYGNGRNDKNMGYIEPAWLVNELRRIAQLVMITPGIKSMYRYPEPDWVGIWYKPAAMGCNGFGGANHWEPILMYGRRFLNCDVFRATIEGANSNGNFHNCPKPERLMSQIIEWSTNINDIVLDIVCGSGTTLAMAKVLGRRWIGFEIDPATADLARRRVEMTQPPPFVMQPEQVEMAL